MARSVLVPLLALSAWGCQSAQAPYPAPPAPPTLSAPERGAAVKEGIRTGLLVMAHGGSAEWDASVSEAVAPLGAAGPTALAFGMADPATLRAALDTLAAEGVGTVAVVRLFMSGRSFLHQTEYLLGLRTDPPAKPLLHAHGPAESGHGAHGGSTPFGPLTHEAQILLGMDGISDAQVARDIVVGRALERSRQPEHEAVLILAHGMGDETENEGVLANMEHASQALRDQGFAAVRAATLREDWPEARQAAESEIRGWVGGRSGEGLRVIVVPYRLSGFGPYAEVLEGLEYEATDGLLPHPLITQWIREGRDRLLCEAGISVTACDAPKSVVAPNPPRGEG